MEKRDSTIDLHMDPLTLDSANIINLKLFPTYPNPPPVYDYQVPISTVNLEALLDVSWDMTMQRITKYINGVNSVKRIAEYADVETGLARLCMQHLLYARNTLFRFISRSNSLMTSTQSTVSNRSCSTFCSIAVTTDVSSWLIFSSSRTFTPSNWR
jgi:hypothetical protein